LDIREKLKKVPEYSKKIPDKIKLLEAIRDVIQGYMEFTEKVWKNAASDGPYSS